MSDWRDLADEHAQLEILERDDRIADLERSLESVSTTLSACLDMLRRVTRDRDDLRELIDYWTAIDPQGAARARARRARRSPSRRRP
ncbi:MAG TPA: hypothetical protein VGD94_24645 [Vicinamibacterales bacterium]